MGFSSPGQQSPTIASSSPAAKGTGSWIQRASRVHGESAGLDVWTSQLTMVTDEPGFIHSEPRLRVWA